jgi:catechol 2,3-dioxygenase-like lactoylglutathione lyase family enzyme
MVHFPDRPLGPAPVPLRAVIQHLALAVTDPARSAQFYAAALAPVGAATRTALYISDGGERPLVVAIEHSLSLMLHAAAEADVRAPSAPGALHHFAVHVETSVLVDRIASAANAAGGRITDGPRRFSEYRFGYYGVFLRDPDDLKWEAFCYTERPLLEP